MGELRGRPFEPGNKFGRGRPKGSRNKIRLEAQQLLEQHAQPIMRKCIILALQGDHTAMRLCVERLAGPIRDASVRLPFGGSDTASDVAAAFQALLKAVGAGSVTPAEGEKIASMLGMRREAIETVDLEKRVAALMEDTGRR
jgi:hypothetical protein